MAENAGGKNTQTPDDIEGLWTYHYFSFNKATKKAVSFFKFGEANAIIQNFDNINLPIINYLKFILGGKNLQYSSIQA